MSCNVGKATEGLENELWRRWSDGKVGKWALLILQAFHRFTYVTAHSQILPSLYLHHSSFSNPSVGSPTSQTILQPFFRFSYVRGSSLTPPSEPRMLTNIWYEEWSMWPQFEAAGSYPCTLIAVTPSASLIICRVSCEFIMTPSLCTLTPCDLHPFYVYIYIVSSNVIILF